MSIFSPGTKVAIIGDSHMEALGPRLARALPERFGVEVTNVEARRGWSARRYLRETNIPAMVRGANVVIVELGGNDASARIGATDHARDVDEMLKRIGAKKVIWVGPGVTERQDLRALREPLRPAQKQVVESRGGHYIDGRDVTATRHLRGDGVHFSGGGYDEMTRLLMSRFANLKDRSLWWVGAIAAGAAGLFAYGAWEYSRR